MPGTTYIPSKDADLLAFGANMGARLTATPTAYGATAAIAATFASAQTAYASALTTATDPITRTKPAILQKDAMRAGLVAQIQFVAKVVTAAPAVTDAQRAQLGLNVRKPPTPNPVPTTSPKIDIVSVDGRVVTFNLHAATTEGKRGKPARVYSAAIYTYVGATPPDDASDYKFEGIATRTDKREVVFADAVPSGAQAWIAAAWMNARGQPGVACAPVGFTIQGGAARPVAAA